MIRATLPVCLLVVGTLFFSRGFLLTRFELAEFATCAEPPAPPPPLLGASRCARIPEVSPTHCWTPPLYARVVLLVVDALRFDFASPDTCWGARNVSTGGAPRHCGAMPLLGARLRASPRDAQLLRADADAPTVTLQRLKALTTGGLPTFIDAASNFASSAAVREDSWLAQLRDAPPLATASAYNLSGAAQWGDDTWLALFPHSPGVVGGAGVWTHGAKPMPSFDTRDLDTVDKSVRRGLLAALAGAAPWRVAVAHTLGVDHVGHSFAADTDEMARKLSDTDSLVESTARALATLSARDGSTALLIVAGDHGMTADGNHGGSSLEEQATALVAVSFGRPLRREGTSASGGPAAARPQIDVVPALALALGLPIPFGSLGTPPRDWSWDGLSRDGVWGARAAARAAELAAEGIARFLLKYAAVAPGFDPDHSRVERIVARLARAREALQNAEANAGRDCAWAADSGGGVDAKSARSRASMLVHEFDAAGALFEAAAREGAAIARASWAQFDTGAITFGLVCLICALVALLWAGCAVPTHAKGRAPARLHVNRVGLFLVALFVLRVSALFSDSFIAAEPAILRNLSCAGVLVAALFAARATRKRSGLVNILLAAVVFCVCSLATEAPPAGWLHILYASFRKGSPAAPSAGAISDETIARLTAGAGARVMPLLPVSPRSFSDLTGGASFFFVLLLGPAARVVLAALPSLIAGATGIDSAAASKLRSWGEKPSLRLSRAVNGLYCASALFVAIYWFLESGILGSRTLSSLNSALSHGQLPPADEFAPRLALVCSALSLSFALTAAAATRPRSATLISLLSWSASLSASAIPALLPIASLLLGPWSPPILFALVVQACALTVFVGAASHALGGSRELTAGLAGLWALWSASTWSATGHAPRLSALAYGAGLVGWRTFSAPRAGAALALNTFGVSHILIAGPLLAIPFALTAALGAGKGAPPPHSFFTLLLAAHAATLTASAILCAVESRHLMTWSVFAPKFLFEAVGAVAHILSGLLALRATSGVASSHGA